MQKLSKILFISLLTTLSATAMSPAPTAAPEAKPALDIQALSPQITLSTTTPKQGDFFTVIIESPSSRPIVNYDSENFDTYEIAPNKYRAHIPVENLTKPGKYKVTTKIGTCTDVKEITVLDNKRAVQKIVVTGKSLDATPLEINTVGRALRTESKDKLWSGKFIYPCKAPKSSPFGVKRSYNGGPVDSYHSGLDFAADMGTPVLAPADGRVMLTGLEKNGYRVNGNIVILDHGQSLVTAYLHLSKIDVKEGDLVKAGTKIGEVGHTGISTGPHLHWGTYLYGTKTDPEQFVAKEAI